MSAWFVSLRACALALAFGAVGVAVYALMENPASPPRRAFSAYVARLDRDLDRLFQPRRGRVIALAQVALIAALAAAAVLSQSSTLGVIVLGVALAPRLLVSRAMARKRINLEQRLPAMAKTLANCLRATPNLVAALQQTQRLSPPGVDRELELMLQEIQLGSTLEPALLRMGARVKSVDLDAVLTGILITRQVGGNLPEVLETLAASLREMARLAGVLRTKTSANKIQFAVVAFLPPGLVMFFEKMRPNHFDAMLASPLGIVIFGGVGLMWVASLFLARKVLAVQL